MIRLLKKLVNFGYAKMITQNKGEIKSNSKIIGKKCQKHDNAQFAYENSDKTCD